MILYLDTSAHLKLYIDEDHSEYTRSIVSRVVTQEDEDSPSGYGTVAVSNVGYVEACSALAAIMRDGRLTKDERERALGMLEQDMRARFRLLNSIEALPIAARLNAGDTGEMATRYAIADGSVTDGPFPDVAEDGNSIPNTYLKHRLKGYDSVHLANALVLRDEARAVSKREYVCRSEAYMEARDRLSAEELAIRFPSGAGYASDEEVMILTFDRELHAAARREGVAHANPALDGGHEFLDIEYDFT